MGKFQNSKEKKTIAYYIRPGILIILVILLAGMPMLASRSKGSEDSQASVLSATVGYKDIDTQIIGGGQLSSTGSLNIRIPENVKLTQYLVGNGDNVKEGETIAMVDKISVMTAITEVQETLDFLAKQIAAASEDTEPTSVRALAGGTVKVIYAQEGESVQDVMLDHGALAVLSLDDMMAVKIEKETTLAAGDIVDITFSDGRSVTGCVKTNLEGVLTITMEDDDYTVGSKVMVSTEDGNELGTGELYILSPWSAAAYSGMISDIFVKENETVAIDRTLFSLENTGKTAQLQRLVDQRQEYENLMQELFTMYRTESITAPCDGIVTGVDEDAAWVLADSRGNWFVNRLSSFGRDQNTGFAAYAASVAEASEGKTILMIDPEGICIPDIPQLSGIAADIASMTKKLDYGGNIPVYTQDRNGLLLNTGTVSAGDAVLAVGDEEQVRWLVLQNESSELAPASQIQDKTGGVSLSMLTASGDSNSNLEYTDDSDSNLEIESGSDNIGDNSDIGEDTGSEKDDSGNDENDGTEDDTVEEKEAYTGFVAQVAEINDGWAKVMQTLYCYSITDLTCLPNVSVSITDLTVEREYTSEIIKTSELKVGDTILIVLDNKGTIKLVSKEAIREFQNAPGQPEDANNDGKPSGGAAGGEGTGGNGALQTFEPYSLEKLTVASVSSQEHMTVSITVDELDITKIYVGQAAIVSVDALGGEQFEAVIAKISNSGENAGGNSKFTVELTLGKSGDMLPGMYASAFITLEQKGNVLCVPVAALGKEGTHTILYTGYDMENRVLENPVVVTIGISDGENAEILNGITAGEVCYYEYYDTYLGSDAPRQQGRRFSLGRILGGR